MIIVGAAFALITAIGMLRFPDFYARLHAGAKCLTASGINIMLGVIFIQGFSFNSLKLIIVIGFLGIVNPVTTHAISRAAYLFGLDPCCDSKGENLEDCVVYSSPILGLDPAQKDSTEAANN
ncbi:monovalent cation/H(+) antiporter subunit G [Fuchsiella alkaliacetigena]|uniref:monovalent cation/H(+) antiporter subunit G n=1 Tax=Fuchsiella alkaliacetigena TaxID=957042 RepID=UPI00200ACF4F|nr:monovalent cation/H(+) antiporter subunit G [Fuchsiella alkaliacetigena]MCK8825930.1 monovalent cation/H(+) antiporter subunit G [Fuchsiella alkaliacetigena]